MPRDTALTEEKSQTRAEAFRDAEASLRIEGLDPTDDPGYQAIKAHLIAGTMTFDGAKAAIKAQYSTSANARRPYAATA